MKNDTRKMINSMLALAMATTVFTGCSRKVDDVELPSKPEVVTSAPTNSEPPVTTSEPPVTTSEPITTSEPVTSEPITSEPVDPDPYVPEPEPEPAVVDTSDPNCPPGFVAKTDSFGTTYYDPNEPGYSGGVGKFQFVGKLSADGSGNVLGFQGLQPGNRGTECIPYYVFQYGDSITDPYDGTEMPVQDSQVGATDCSGTRAAIRGHYIDTHPEYNTVGHISEEELASIWGW